MKRNPRTILVVEDDESVRRLLRRLLGRAGMRVIDVGTCAGAVEALREHPGEFALLVVDRRLPDGDGRTLAATLGRQSAAPVLFITGWADEDDEGEVLMEGQRLLQKPFSGVEFLRTVAGILHITPEF